MFVSFDISDRAMRKTSLPADRNIFFFCYPSPYRSPFNAHPAASSLPSDPAESGNYVVRNVRLKKNTVKSISMMLYARNPTMPMML